MRRRFKRRGRKMFRRRRFGRKRKSWGGTLKFATRYPGGNRATQVPIPQTYFTKHPFYTTLNVGSGTSFDLTSITMNSLFNMDGLGADAGYAAAMNLFWENWVVLGCHFVISYSTTEADTPAVIYSLPWPNVADPTDKDDMQYRGGCRTRLLSSEFGSKSVSTLKGYVNIAQLTGQKVVVEQDFWGTNTAAPVNLTPLYMAFDTTNGTTSSYSLRIHLTLYVKWFNKQASSGDPSLELLSGPTFPSSSKVLMLQMRNHLKMLESNVKPEKADMDIEGLEEETESVEEEEKAFEPCPICKVVNVSGVISDVFK